MRTIDFVITDENAGKRIKEFLRAFGVSGSLLKRLKNTENGICKNGAPARTIDTVFCGDRLQINIEDSGKAPESADIKINLLYEDEDLIAAEKPAFMPVHESRNHRGDTLSNAVADICGGAFRAIYRLDRDTSGIVLIAKNEFAAAKLAGRVRKDYYAVVCGRIEGSGVIDAPIARVGEEKRFCVSPDGAPSLTRYEVLGSADGLSLVRLRPETGRTHQIRVHMSSIGCPLLGDRLYGKLSREIDRPALHSAALTLLHPLTGETVKAAAPVPEDMLCVLPPELRALLAGLQP